MRAQLPVALILVAMISGNSHAQSVLSDSTLQEALNDIDVGDRWQYNDWEAARTAAAKSGKPIFALFR